MLSYDETNLIKTYLPFYSHLNIEEQDILKRSMARRILLKGENLQKQHNDCNGLVVVEHGRIRAYIMSEDGREVTLFRLADGEICLLTASCLFHNLNFEVHFEVEKDSAVFFIPSPDFEILSTNNIYVKEYMLNQMALRFSNAMWVMEQIVFGGLSKRVAGFILEQTILENSKVLAITHETIAKNIGSAREVVSRMLKHMENDKIVQTSRGTLVVEDLNKLRELAH